jgi:PhzF family phenazine biosynthesis protein
MPLEFFQVDAFASRPFEGNPAAIAVLEGPDFPAAELMQSIALEMNLSETAFVTAPNVDGVRALRWFTPTVEVNLCGHATLAASHVLWQHAGEVADTIVFGTLSGELSARRLEGGLIAMDLPADPPEVCEPPAGLGEALRIEGEEFAAGTGYLLVRVAGPAEVAAVAPDMSRLATLGPRGVVVTAPAAPGDDADFVSRVFVPSAGVPEDPVTGSAHCVLAPYWAERLGKDRLLAFQASARGGHLQVTHRGDRVELAGRAVTVARIAMV